MLRVPNTKPAMYEMLVDQTVSNLYYYLVKNLNIFYTMTICQIILRIYNMLWFNGQFLYHHVWNCGLDFHKIYHKGNWVKMLDQMDRQTYQTIQRVLMCILPQLSVITACSHVLQVVQSIENQNGQTFLFWLLELIYCTVFEDRNSSQFSELLFHYSCWGK